MKQSQLEKLADLVRSYGFCASVQAKGVIVHMTDDNGRDKQKLVYDSLEALKLVAA